MLKCKKSIVDKNMTSKPFKPINSSDITNLHQEMANLSPLGPQSNEAHPSIKLHSQCLPKIKLPQAVLKSFVCLLKLFCPRLSDLIIL